MKARSDHSTDHKYNNLPKNWNNQNYWNENVEIVNYVITWLLKNYYDKPIMSSLYPSMYFILTFFTEKLNSLIVEKPTTKAKDSFKKILALLLNGILGSFKIIYKI